MNAISWTYVILAEAVNPEHGLGYMVELARTHQKASWSFAGLLVIGGIGLITDQIIRTASKLLFRWREAEPVSNSTPHKPQDGEPGTLVLDLGKTEQRGTYKPTLATNQTPKLRLSDVGVTYVDRTGRKTEAVREVTLDLLDKPGCGEIVVFLGPSGCGKSTILKAVAGLLTPTRGEILVDGDPVSDVGRDRGMVFQTYTSFAWLTVRDNVEYGLRLQRRARMRRAQESSRSSYLEPSASPTSPTAIRKSSPAA